MLGNGHADIEQAVAARCPIEMGGYDSLEQLQRAWDTRHAALSTPGTPEDASDAEACPFCGSTQVTIYPFGQGTISYAEDAPVLYISSATCRCRGCTAEIDGPQRKSIIEGEDEYNACIAALKTWNTRYTDPDGSQTDWEACNGKTQ